ncbi:ssDNA endodeoxyribonuclease RAD2 Ecym_5112 [Eremothecium cymbalariae DBVPG|uniref:DNA repair protein RAD2 n=1 Tax=Eremothecium cymbalariae (strain CBS 270.75 / DBVPG 7215 / KCTC 17166 / NRRL Y-17582) TaxID=931890 RepID=I6NCV1_ERECY|nr:hypothetical protein Ecym_5112 [Eremothecium cymbalariae DBVPG\
MGVHSLWDIVGPTTKPVRLESLSNKRMAVDASIWIYQFLKATPDNGSHKLKNAHILGFFRRICKVLYFGMKPVFVFDGGAPPLKRETIRQRREARQGKRADAAVTAQKLLALQIYKQQDEKTTGSPKKNHVGGVLFRPADEYELPQIPGFVYDEKDTRISAAEDIKTVMDHSDELDGIDLTSINPASKEFDELPKSTQYLVLSVLRLRSRLRMGYTKEQLEELFPNSMDFSKFQIDMVKKRNFFTQKLMNITGINDGGSLETNEVISRISGQRDTEYKLIKTETGWAMSLGPQDGSEVSKAIIIDDQNVTPSRRGIAKEQQDDNNESEESIEWEDINVNIGKKKEQLDYSMKASILPPLLQENSAVGSQSFLDKRGNLTTPSKQSKRNPVRYTESSDEDSDEEYIKQIEEMEAIEAMQRSQALRNTNLQRKSISEIGDKNIQERDISNDTHYQEIQIAAGKTSNTTKFQSESKIIDKLYHVNEENEASHQQPPASKISQQVVGNLTSGSKKERDELSEISGLHLDGNSFLFDVDEPELPSRKEGSKNTKKTVETPLWFQSHNDPSSNNHYLKDSFVKDKVANPSAITEDEKFRLYTGHRARELIEEVTNPVDLEIEEVDVSEPEILKELPVADTDQRKGDVDDPNKSMDQTLLPKTGTNIHEPFLDYYFSEEEEEELAKQLVSEQEGYNNFKKTLNPDIVSNAFIEDELYKQYQKDMSAADEVTVEMVTQIQELLTRFGIPYVTAPMEAEAQCAELLKLKLVDGIITDDSDIFLFGGSNVYKNMFYEKAFVEYYSSDSISLNLGLNRDMLISLAELLGSDYTTGVKGVGPVSGMEILAEFRDLETFRNWYNDGQFDKKNLENESTFRKNLRRKLMKNDVILGDNFPNPFVRNAYMNPEVDHDTTNFVWGIPDLDQLRSYLHSNLGWPSEKSDEVLGPLIRELNKRKTTGAQTTLGEFFPTKLVENEKNLKLGKRIKHAAGLLKKQRIR